MTTSVTIGATSEIPNGQRRFYTVDGEPIAILNVEGRLYAIRNSCPHMGGPVGEGKVFVRTAGTRPVSRFANFTPGGCSRVSHCSRPSENPSSTPTIACPLHGWEFDLADGTPAFPAKRGLKTYPIRVEDGLVRIETDAADGEEKPLAVPAR